MNTQLDMDNPLAEPTTVRGRHPGAKDPAAATTSAAGSTSSGAAKRGRKAVDQQLKQDLKEFEEKLARLLELPPEDYEVVARVSEEFGESYRSFAQIELDNNYPPEGGG